jgi:hypothetical protein
MPLQNLRIDVSIAITAFRLPALLAPPARPFGQSRRAGLAVYVPLGSKSSSAGFLLGFFLWAE